jgi:hypothetical protein
MTSISKGKDQATSAVLTEAVDVVLSFGVSMMQGGRGKYYEPDMMGWMAW